MSRADLIDTLAGAMDGLETHEPPEEPSEETADEPTEGAPEAEPEDEPADEPTKEAPGGDDVVDAFEIPGVGTFTLEELQEMKAAKDKVAEVFNKVFAQN